MQRYFATRNKNQIILGDGDVHHLLHVMRARINDEIEAVIEGKLYSGIIKSLNPLNIEINYEIPLDSELPYPVTLFFALAKGDKIEFVIQKATELGVSRIVLVKTERCVTKFSDEDFRRKLERFNKISKEASEQSHRLVIPEIVGVIDINNIPSDLLADHSLLAYEKEAGQTSSFLEQVNDKTSYAIMIGPEGGFSNEEVNILTSKYHFELVSLGKRILRTETAAVYALSVLGCLLEK